MQTQSSGRSPLQEKSRGGVLDELWKSDLLARLASWEIATSTEEARANNRGKNCASSLMQGQMLWELSMFTTEKLGGIADEDENFAGCFLVFSVS